VRYKGLIGANSSFGQKCGFSVRQFGDAEKPSSGNEQVAAATLVFNGEQFDLAYTQNNPPTVVLIVEDEFLIRMNAVDMIRSGGFEVIEAKNADEALEILERRVDIAVVFTDIHMPGSMDGLKLAAAIRDRWPPIKIVATSGRAKPSAEDLPSNGCFLPKPYNAREVVMVLREVTGAQ